MFTVLANMRINSPGRLEHLRDSLDSFSDATDDWLINIRGAKREEAMALLKERLGKRATFFELLDDSRGWGENALEMLSHAKYPYVMLWIEDHINVAPSGFLQQVVREMEKEKADCLQYSWWRVGWSKDQMDSLPFTRAETVDVVTVDRNVWQKVGSIGRAPYLVSLVSIFKKESLQRLLQSERRLLPYAITPFLYRFFALLRKFGVRMTTREMFYALDGAVGHRLARFSKETPFNLERGPHRLDILPLRVAFANKELFVCVDDDMDSKDHSYSLVSRGEYPTRETLLTWEPSIEVSGHTRENRQIAKGEIVRERYAFYPDAKHLRAEVAREYVHVLEGQVTVTVGPKSVQLHKGEGASFFTNLPHEIRADEASEIARLVPDLGLARYSFST